jgi:hypothetical protein
MDPYLQANSVSKHSRQQAFAGVIDLPHSAKIDLHRALTPSIIPATFEFGEVARCKRSGENESSSASVAEGFNSKHDELSVGVCSAAGR